MLELRPGCEHCGTALPPDSDRARVCTFECTFCVDCATWQLLGICPNCGGELVIRPRRPAAKLASAPASTVEVRNSHDIAAHQATVNERLVAGDLPEATWINSFPNERMPNDAGYGAMAMKMDALAAQQPGYLGIDAVRGADGVGITVSRWSSLAAMVAWRRLGDHADAQQQGRAQWYRRYRSDVARVDRTASFERTD